MNQEQPIGSDQQGLVSARRRSAARWELKSRVALTAGLLELVKEVEQTKCEGGAGSLPGSREPPGAEQLDMRRNSGTVRLAFAIGNVDRMDATDIKNCEGDGRGGYTTGDSMVVAELEEGTKVFKQCPCEVGSCPTLRGVSSCMGL